MHTFLRFRALVLVWGRSQREQSDIVFTPFYGQPLVQASKM